MNPLSRVYKFTAFFVGVLLLIWSVYLAVSAWSATGSMGVLKLTSGDKTASFSISTANRQARYVGTGSANVRLTPGTYLVMASDKGQRAQAVAAVIKKQTKSVALNPSSASLLPTVESINFNGVSSLSDRAGLSSDQIALLELDFFRYNTTAKTVTIDAGSVQPEAHNPDVDTSFKVDFSVSVDSQGLKAKIEYSGLNDVHLWLYNISGQQLFDSSG